MPSVDDVQEAGDLGGLPKEDLIAFLKSDREDKIELWNAWRRANDQRPVDLKEADLTEAHLKGANLRWAYLERADLERACLERANLYEAHLEEARLRRARLGGADLRGARLEGANLREARLDDANLHRAHLDGANLREARLDDANLHRAHLRGVDLSPVESLRGVKLYQTYFWGVLSLRHVQFLGNGRAGESTIWEETEGHFSEAKDVFSVLRRYFEDAGDNEGANWAYVRERVMEKLMRTPHPLRWPLYPRWRGRWDDDFCEPDLFKWLWLESSEKIAYYGLSLSRPVLGLAVIVLIFAAIYVCGGLITSMPNCSYNDLARTGQEGCHPTRSFIDGLVFSLGALTTSDTVAVQPYKPNVSWLMSLEALFGIAMAALIGYVLGNRQR